MSEVVTTRGTLVAGSSDAATTAHAVPRPLPKPPAPAGPDLPHP
ncbi:hypothetical protein ACFPYI_11675 [Halomarina salina]|uniref:Uncharacterized protein n=1 Tax=Halomarina salina TaxID=1872699 RepID=A0ABD5RMV5_9EURY|nr:hypothetical protein [Halomarina salina]